MSTTHKNTVTLGDRHDAIAVYLAVVAEILGESYRPSRLPGEYHQPRECAWRFEHDDRRTAEEFAGGCRTLHDERTVVVLDGTAVTVTSELGSTAEGNGIAGLLELPRMLARGRELMAFAVEQAAHYHAESAAHAAVRRVLAGRSFADDPEIQRAIDER